MECRWREEQNSASTRRDANAMKASVVWPAVPPPEVGEMDMEWKTSNIGRAENQISLRSVRRAHQEKRETTQVGTSELEHFLLNTGQEATSMSLP